MKKRILCMLLALVMVLGMIPVTAMRASAASSAISEKGITILKGDRKSTRLNSSHAT